MAVRRWEVGRDAVDRMLAIGELERVPANREHAGHLLGLASTHVHSATRLSDDDPELAFAAAYDAARKALTAALAVQGLRPTTRGRHVAVRDAALAQFSPSFAALIKRFDWMRRTRNDSEYPDLDSPGIFPEDVAEAIDYATEIVDKAVRLVETLPPYGR